MYSKVRFMTKLCLTLHIKFCLTDTHMEQPPHGEYTEAEESVARAHARTRTVAFDYACHHLSITPAPSPGGERKGVKDTQSALERSAHLPGEAQMTQRSGDAAFIGGHT